jgi:hypothetical protein
MKIKAKQSFGHSTSKQTFQSGKEYDVKDDHGHEFVNAGLADLIPDPVKIEVVKVKESKKE